MEKKLEIDVARLDAGGEDFDGELDSAVLEMDGDLLRAFGGLRYSLFVQLLDSELLVRGTLAQDFEAVCSRCGCDFTFTAEVPDFTISVEIGEKTEYVDLTDELRQSIILALPTYPVCRQDCLGVCPTCGKDLNKGPCTCSREVRDNRWAALDAVRTDRDDRG